MADLRKYIGPVNKAQIIEDIVLERLSPKDVFIKRELVLVLSDGVGIPLVSPEYLEFHNTTNDRKRILEINLEQNHVNAIMAIWGKQPCCED